MVGLVSGVGCGDNNSGGITFAEYAAENADAACSYLTRCGLYTNVSDCKKYLSGTISPELEAFINSNKATFHGEIAAECLARLNNLSCAPADESYRTGGQGCVDIVTGNTAPGRACTTSLQCESGRCIREGTISNCEPGVCGPLNPPGAAGEACVNDGVLECKDGLFCDASGVCVGLLSAGATCFFSSDCGYGLTCFSPTNKCTATVTTGASCAAADCDKVGDQCDAITMTCKPLGRTGEACSPTLACISPLTCNQTTNTCLPRATLGQPCTDDCELGSFCNYDSDFCESLKPDGATCKSSSACSSRYCEIVSGADAGTCKSEQVCF